jgi:hypothetical protein
MNHGNQFDSVLNEALREYREAEPLAGIEDRVLRRVQNHIERSPALGWRWRVALAMITILITLGIRKAQPHQPSPPQVVQQRTPVSGAPPVTRDARSNESRVAPEHTMQSRASKEQARQRLKLANTTRPPVQAEFPLPTPLDSQERALLALAQTNPDALRPLLDDDTKDALAPIIIPPLAKSDSDTEGED